MSINALSVPPKFLDFPIHRLVDCGKPKVISPEEKFSDTGVYELKKRVLERAFEVLKKFDIDGYSSIGKLLQLAHKVELGLHKKDKGSVVEALSIVFNRIKNEIDRIRPEISNTQFELISKGWDLEILGGKTEKQSPTLGNPRLWSKYGPHLQKVYEKYGNPRNIRDRLKAIRKALDGGGGNVSYRGQWREATWERNISTLHILEFQYLLENDLLDDDDQPQYC